MSLSGLLYFITLAGLFVYANVLLLSRRHWPLEADGFKMSYHHSARTAALLIGVISLNVLFGRLNWRLDVTAEQLHSLSSETHHLLEQLPEDRPVF
ncbi:ABC transporter, partial [candidate division KSB1 bacterium]|nr:ABC transporter [candidate division KSB1 bacterium]NIT72878.1 ABC transporter [candidate division KSB1 bacterium]NIU23242.1 ABC transporter [candidate division KSB1 bacterium]NIU91978.1 ABC transporter [candidate division KSB1 bacterium]NIW17106.1 ABC transporter [candidate division KSB1 bacterium]